MRFNLLVLTVVLGSASAGPCRPSSASSALESTVETSLTSGFETTTLVDVTTTSTEQPVDVTTTAVPTTKTTSMIESTTESTAAATSTTVPPPTCNAPAGLQCCGSTGHPNDGPVSLLLGLLGIVVKDTNTLIGLTSPPERVGSQSTNSPVTNAVNGSGFKPRAKRQHALVSNDYDSKLDAISRKLDRISLAVDSITTPSQQQGGSSAAHTAFSSRVTPISHANSPSNNAPARKEADSELVADVTLTTQATFATDFLQQVVDNNQPSHTLPEIKTSLDTLRRILTDKDVSADEPRLVDTQGVLSPQNQGGFQLPPINLAMMAIQRLRESTKLKFLWRAEFHSIAQFAEYLMTVYFGKPTLADLIITHVGLQSLLFECGDLEPEEGLKNEFKSQAMLCRQNLETILAGLPFNLPCSPDYLLALFMAATYHLYHCRISMSWNCLAAAAQMCQILGFTRDVLQRAETREARQRRAKLVWCIHMFDKMLALRLSRPALIREGEISINFESLEADASDGPTPIVAKWAHFVDLQGRIYDTLYCPRALLQSDAQREACARQLAVDMETLFHTKSTAEEHLFESIRTSFGDVQSELCRRADQVAYQSMRCLVFRAIKPSSSTSSAFCEECLAAAKDGLEQHRLCMSLLEVVEASIFEFYVHWGLMSVPLVPFMVLFCHAIETCDPVHLTPLASVVETIDRIPPELPSVYRKQLRLFKVMYEVACKYLSSRPSNPPVHASGRIPDTPFEMLYVEAGIPFPSHLNMQANMPGFQSSTHHATGMDLGGFTEPGQQMMGDGTLNHSMDLGNWFEQNQEIFMMLDNDLQ
ncbi:hypothetical protein F53441_490 [Fusarium austroafricanum]|uniref:Xylanolytic transcriptional activator regulatory domain-containing protein n=1 Tax=Fusarium austroafricanum TaxID=2364996 RepID=A0A8H4KWS3_9HYPO|nr:hypothetical protein F53441_490 [Fusarium austroafricanum]